MKFNNKLTLVGVFTSLFVFTVLFSSFADELVHVGKLFSLRDVITNQGNVLPEKIQQTDGIDRRTLERIFELNTSTLTTIEAYFRILMITIVTENEKNPEAIKILNEWLEFTKNQCKYDIEYLDSTLEDTRDQVVVDEINVTKESILSLKKIANSAIIENDAMLKQTTQ